MMKSPREIQTIAKILGGVPILGVLPGSPAHQAGMRYGDIILRVNGLAASSFDRFLSAHRDSDGPIALEIFRNGETVCMDVDTARRYSSGHSSSKIALA